MYISQLGGKLGPLRASSSIASAFRPDRRACLQILSLGKGRGSLLSLERRTQVLTPVTQLPSGPEMGMKLQYSCLTLVTPMRSSLPRCSSFQCCLLFKLPLQWALSNLSYPVTKTLCPQLPSQLPPWRMLYVLALPEGKQYPLEQVLPILSRLLPSSMSSEGLLAFFTFSLPHQAMTCLPLSNHSLPLRYTTHLHLPSFGLLSAPLSRRSHGTLK